MKLISWVLEVRNPQCAILRAALLPVVNHELAWLCGCCKDLFTSQFYADSVGLGDIE